ncbi:hypothetical protein Anapl_11355 [Anas platyrhynchos]|uniref:Uncharacterized protein n=1 Tax=Anas platyrhynchos TaxID=8839 RepID=R0JY14_ANAPL|nr:hypothetical protein Anapl_11355 [Anas platyrhynchos]
MNRDCPQKAEISESRQFLQRTKEPPCSVGQLSRTAPDAEAQSHGTCSKTRGINTQQKCYKFLVCLIPNTSAFRGPRFHTTHLVPEQFIASPSATAHADFTLPQVLGALWGSRPPEGTFQEPAIPFVSQKQHCDNARFALPQRALQLHGQLHRKLYFSIVLPHLFGSLGEDDAWLNNMLLLYGKPMRNLTHTSLYLAPVEADTVLSCDGINLYWKMLTS